MAVRKPVVRHFIACEDIESSSDGRHVSLINVIYAIRPLAGALFPHIEPEICLYAVLTDASGEHTFQVALVTWDENGEEQWIARTRAVTLNIGQDPLAVRGWPIRWRNLPFPRSGLYEFRLLCGNESIATETILWRDVP